MNSSRRNCTAARRRAATRLRRGALSAAALGALALALAGCERPVPAEAQGCDVVRPTLGFALDIPAGWTVRELGGDVVVEILATDRRAAAARGDETAGAATPPETQARRPGAVIHVLVIERQGTGLEAWADETTAELVELQPDLVISARDESELADGHEAILLTLESPRGLEPQEQRMLLAVTDERAYALIVSATESEMAAVEAEIQVCFDSFIVW
ncbi:MAG TPA: hypothetical protein VMY35_15325 [Phycisphaerae bacterium]|nr:hypothetical protein [Phycisphaerae bacterium]